jgi:tetratricopeptide (TPR) repeat protein
MTMGDQPRIDDGLARQLLELAEASAPGRPDHESHAARLLAAADDVAAAVEALLRTDPAAAARMTAALPRFWQDAGRVDEGRRLTERAIEAFVGPTTPALARTLLAAAELAFRQGDQAVAEQRSHDAIAVGLKVGDDAAVALAHTDLARVAYRAGDAGRMEEHAQRALEIGGDDPLARRGALHMLAWAAHTAGDLALAKRRFEESLAYRREVGDRLSVAVEIANLGDLAAEQGDLADAARRLGEALEVGRELDSQYMMLNLLPSLGALAARAGDDEAAARLLGATDALSRSSGLIPDPGNWQPVMDDVATRLGGRLDALRAEGATLDHDAAIDLALRVAKSVAGQAGALA